MPTDGFSSHQGDSLDSDFVAAELEQITMTASAWLAASDPGIPSPPKCLELEEEAAAPVCKKHDESMMVHQLTIAVERQIEETLAKQYQELLSNMRELMIDRAAHKTGCSSVARAPIMLHEENNAPTQAPRDSTLSKLSKKSLPKVKGEHDGDDTYSPNRTSTSSRHNFRISFRNISQLTKNTTAVWNDEKINDSMVDVGELEPEKNSEPRISRYMLSPTGRLRMCWDGLWCFSLAYDMWWSMFLLVFAAEPDKALNTFERLSLITLYFWACDVIVNFFTGYVVDGRHIVLDRAAVIHKYARGWLCFDLVAAFPWEKLVDIDGGSKTFALSRAAKASKAIKLIKALRLIRAIKLLQMEKESQFLKANVWITKYCGTIAGPLSILVVLFCIFSHFHACLWAAVNPDWHATSDGLVALERYRESFWWAYTAMTFGMEVRSTLITQACVEALLASERFFFLGIVGTFTMLKTLEYFQQHTLSSIAQQDALLYMRERDVGVETQIEVLYSVHDTVPAMRKQRNFQSVVARLPVELKRRICTELWSEHLLTLELLAMTEQFHADIIVELAQVVKEEVYAAKAVVCREGDPAIAAYYLLQGKIRLVSSMRSTPVPDFVPGNWMGERALLRTGLNRSATAICLQYSSVMMVPAQTFHELLEKFGIIDKFRQFVEHELQFLCGRCGTIGDHDSDNCPIR